MSFGLVITPDFIPPIKDQNELNVPYYRSILYKLDDMNKLANTKKPLVITLNNQCQEVKSDWSGWDDVIFKLCTQYPTADIRYIVAGNELDIYWHRDKSTSPDFAADIARRAARIAHYFGIKVSATSLADEWWPSYLEALANLCRDDVDAFDIHPYGKQPNYWGNGPWMFGLLEDTIKSVQEIGKKEVIISEYGVKIGDAGSEQEVAKFLKAADMTLNNLGVDTKCWFAYSDAIGTTSEQGTEAFGLLSAQNNKRAAWYIYRNINEGTVMAQTPFEVFEKKYTRVGHGLLEMMFEDNTEPLMDSEWRPFDRSSATPATIEQCIGKNHTTYCWDLPNNSGWRILPH